MDSLEITFDLFDIMDKNINNDCLGMAIRAAIHYAQGTLDQEEEEDVNSIDTSSIYFKLLVQQIDRETGA